MPRMVKMKRNVNSDFYFNHKEKAKEMEEYCDVTVVDAMGAIVPMGKEGSLDKVQENVRERFNLGGDE